MALLMGGSLLLIAASAGVLVVGWLNASSSMVLTSMSGLVAAGVLLGLAYVRGRRLVDGVTVAPEMEPAEAQVQAGGGPVDLRDHLAPEAPVATAEQDVAAPAGPAPAPKKAAPKEATATKPAVTKKTTAKKPAVTKKTTATKKTASKRPPRVVVFPDRDRYHRPECRFAKGRGSDKVTKATARRRGYEPCGVCNP